MLKSVGIVLVVLMVAVVTAARPIPVLPPSFSVWMESTVLSLGATQDTAQHYDAVDGRVMIDYAAPYGNTVVTAENPQPNGTLFELFQYSPLGTADRMITRWAQTLVTPTGNTPPFITCERTAVSTNTASAGDHSYMPYADVLATGAVIASAESRYIRGIESDSYTFAIDATTNATWYFAAGLTTKPPTNFTRPPLRLEITTANDQLLRTIEFTGFVPGRPLASSFALPAFGQCIVGTTKPFPHTPSTDYSTELEINVADGNQLLTIQSANYYDVSHNRVHVQSHSGAYNDTTQLMFYDTNIFVTVAVSSQCQLLHYRCYIES